MANVLLPNGKVEFVQGASCGSRTFAIVADKKVSIKKKNSGFKGANCVDFGHFIYNYEYGGLSPEKTYQVLVTIAKEEFLDLSSVVLVKYVKDIPKEGEYLLLQGNCPEDVFSNYMNPPVILDNCEDEEDADDWEINEEG